jgi:hypothetical protein
MAGSTAESCRKQSTGDSKRFWTRAGEGTERRGFSKLGTPGHRGDRSFS